MPKRLTARMSSGANIDYANARVRARRARLMKPADYGPLIALDSLDELIVEMGRSKYSDGIERAMLTLSGAPIVGWATGEYFAQELATVMKLYGPTQGRALIALGAMWDIEDLKTVVRSVYAGQPAATAISSFRGAGITIGHDELAMLAREQSVEAAVAAASTLNLPYAAALRLGAKRYAASKTLADFESALDQHYAEWVGGELKASRGGGLAGEYIREVIDSRNIMTALRWIGSGGVGRVMSSLASSPTPNPRGGALAGEAGAGQPGVRKLVDAYLVPGGAEVDASMFRRLISAGTVEDAVSVLVSTRYSQAMKRVLGEYALSGSLSEFDRALASRATKVAVQAGKRDLLGMGVPTAYVLALDAEVANLRVIAHGKAFGIPAEMLSKELTLV